MGLGDVMPQLPRRLQKTAGLMLPGALRQYALGTMLELSVKAAELSWRAANAQAWESAAY